MDACTYESITGLKNYYGFKSLLKNGAWTKRYGCDDDTIVFNRIESFTFTSGGFILSPNQVGVIINCTTDYYFLSGSSWVIAPITVTDVDNQVVILNCSADVKGIVVTNTIQAYVTGPRLNLVLAIFDLY